VKKEEDEEGEETEENDKVLLILNYINSNINYILLLLKHLLKILFFRKLINNYMLYQL